MGAETEHSRSPFDQDVDESLRAERLAVAAREVEQLRALVEERARADAAHWLRAQLAARRKQTVAELTVAVERARRETEQRMRGAVVAAQRRAETLERRLAEGDGFDPPASPTTAELSIVQQPARVSLRQAELDDLCRLGMSVTQAKRVIHHRDQRGGFYSLDDLDQFPGFPRSLLTEIKRRLIL